MRKLFLIPIVILTGCASHRVAFTVGHDGHNPTFNVTFDPKETHANHANSHRLHHEATRRQAD